MSEARTKDKRDLQDTVLNHIRRGRIPVTVFLVSGVRLQGTIASFDSFCILLQRDAHSQLIYKHAISTVMPGVPISLEAYREDGVPAEASAGHEC